MKGAVIACLIFGCVLAASAQSRSGSTRIRVAHLEYDCSCSSYCPRYGITAGPCSDDSDNWMWGRVSQYCCVPSFLDYDRPDNDGFGGFGRFGGYGMQSMYGMGMYNSK